MKLYYLIIMVFITMVRPGVALLRAQARPKQEQLVLRLYLDTTEIVPYQPITAVVTLRNATRETFKHSAHPDLQFLITDDKGVTRRTNGRAQGDLRVGVPLVGKFTIASGQTVIFNRILFSKPTETPQEFVFTKPGIYLVKTQLRMHTRVFELDPVKVMVSEPSAEESAAADLIKEPLTALMIQGFTSQAKGVALLEEFLSKFPESPHADYAHYRVGRYFSRKLDKDAEAGIKAFAHLSAASGSMPLLKTDALYRQAKLVCDSTAVRKKVDIPDLLHQLKETAETAKAIGLEKKISEVQEKLKALSESELKN